MTVAEALEKYRQAAITVEELRVQHEQLSEARRVAYREAEAATEAHAHATSAMHFASDELRKALLGVER